MSWHHQWCSCYHPYSCDEVRLRASKQDGPTVSLGECIFSYSFECNCMPTSVDSHVSKDFLQVYLCFPDCWRGSLDHGLSLNNIAPNMIWMCSFIDYLSLNTIVFSTLIHHLIIFHCPQLIWILFVFLPMIHCIASRCLNFSRSIEKSWCHFMSNISQTHSMFFIVRQSFLFWNQISYFKDHVNSSLIVEMKSKRYQFWKRSFENHAFWSKTQHTLFNIVLWLSCILKTEMTHCKFKMIFSWFFMSVLIFDLGYIFSRSAMRWPLCEFQKQDSSQISGFIKRGCFFLSFYFISMHNNQ